MAAAGNQIYESANSLQAANLLRRARQELDAGDTDAAISYLKKALDMQPDYAEAWWELVQIGTKQMTKLSEDEPFALDKDTQRAWNLVRDYASGAQLASYEAQMRDYEQRWTAGINHKKAEQLFQEIREKTGEGKLFDRYTQYYSQSVKVEQCLSLADEGQKKTIQAYMQSYEENHAKFRELQEWKRSRPIDQFQQDQEYQRIAREQQKYKEESRGRGAAAKRRTVRGRSACGGSPGCDLFGVWLFRSVAGKRENATAGSAICLWDSALPVHHAAAALPELVKVRIRIM